MKYSKYLKLALFIAFTAWAYYTNRYSGIYPILSLTCLYLLLYYVFLSKDEMLVLKIMNVYNKKIVKDSGFSVNIYYLINIITWSISYLILFTIFFIVSIISTYLANY